MPRKPPPPGPGRPKGLLNKSTRFGRDLIQNILDNGSAKFETELKSLSGKEYCSVYADLMEYCAPKLARTEIIADKQQDINIYLPAQIASKD